MPPKKQLIVYLVIIFVLCLTAFNVYLVSTPKKVLGVSIQENSQGKFWSEFLQKHPNYIPGLIEIGQIQKVKQIDPNYLPELE